MEKTLEKKAEIFFKLVHESVRACEENWPVGMKVSTERELVTFGNKNPEIFDYVLRNYTPPHSSEIITNGFLYAAILKSLERPNFKPTKGKITNYNNDGISFCA